MTTDSADAFVPGIDRSLLGSLDKRFAALLGLSMAAHFALATYLQAQPARVSDELVDAPPPVTRRLVLPLPVPKPDPAPAGAASPPKPKAGPAVAAGDGQPVDLRRSGLIGVIGAAGGKGGAFGELMDEGGAGSLAKALEGARGLHVASAAEAAERKDGTGPGAQGIDPLRTDGARAVRLGEAGVRGPPKPKDLILDWQPKGAPLELAGLQQFVNARKKSVQHCYERELKRFPSLQGRLLVRLTLEGPGRAASVDVDDETMGNGAVASCVRTVISGWVFPFQAHASVDLPFVFDRSE